MVKIDNILLYKLSNEELNIIENININMQSSIYISTTSTLILNFLSKTNNKKSIYAVNQRKSQSP